MPPAAAQNSMKISKEIFSDFEMKTTICPGYRLQIDATILDIYIMSQIYG